MQDNDWALENIESLPKKNKNSNHKMQEKNINAERKRNFYWNETVGNNS